MTNRKNYYKNIALSERETQCLYYLLTGKSAASTAKLLGLSPKTVEYYIENVKLKMACNTREELIKKSIEKGYLVILL